MIFPTGSSSILLIDNHNDDSIDKVKLNVIHIVPLPLLVLIVVVVLLLLSYSISTIHY